MNDDLEPGASPPGEGSAPVFDHVPVIAGWTPAALSVEGLARFEHRQGQEAVYRRPPGTVAAPDLIERGHVEQIGAALRRLSRHGVTLRRLVPDDVMLDGVSASLRGTCRPERAPGRTAIIRRRRAGTRNRRLLADLAARTDGAAPTVTDGTAPETARSGPERPDGPRPSARSAVPTQRNPRPASGSAYPTATPVTALRWIVVGALAGLAVMSALLAVGGRRSPGSDPMVRSSVPVTGVDAPATLVHAGATFMVGREGDRVLVGDWDGDGQATPAVVRAANGRVYRWDSWPSEGPGTPGTPVATLDRSAGSAGSAGSAQISVVSCAQAPGPGDRQIDLDSGGPGRSCLRASTSSAVVTETQP